jgi:hypothetical protein
MLHYNNQRRHRETPSGGEEAVMVRAGWVYLGMAVGLALGACATATPPALAVEDAAILVGAWSVDHPDWAPAYMILKDGGRFTFAPNLEGSHGQSGDYWMEDGRFFIAISPFCEDPGEYEVGLRTEDGRTTSLVFTVVEDDCAPRLRILTRREPEYIAP